MNDKSYIVFPLRRVAACIYDFFLLLGVWFAVGSVAVWINGGIIEAKWVGPLLIFVSTWCFYGYFWTHGGKTLGMAVWKFEIYSLDNKKINIKKISLRFFMNLITFALFGIPLLYMYISKDKLSPSDIVSQTSYKKILNHTDDNNDLNSFKR